MIDLSYFTIIGLYLLYLPPTFTFIFQKQLEHNRESLSYKNILTFSFIFMLIMMVMMQEAYYVFWFYFIMFNLFLFYVDRLTLDRAKAFSLSIYACFAVSVLWEWPIQLTIFQNIDAVILSVFKALGIIFFYYTLRHTHFKLNDRLILLLLSTLFLGLLITLGIWLLGIESMFYVTHFYRLPWVLILLYSVYLAYKPLNKEVYPDKSGLGR